MGMGTLATGLLGAISGGAKAYGEVIDKRMEDKSAMDKMRSIEEFKAEMEQKREARLEAHRKEINQQVSARAGELANKGLDQNLDQADKIYAESVASGQMSESDGILGKNAVAEARKNREAPKAEHLMAAAGEFGQVGTTDMINYADKQDATKYARDKDAKATAYTAERDKVEDAFKQKDDSRADQELGLRSQQLRHSISTAAAAAADAAESRANKKQLGPLYEQLGMAIAQEEASPDTMDGTVKSLKIKIKSLGGDATAMDAALLGPTEKSKETTTRYVDGNEVKTERDVVTRPSKNKPAAPTSGTRRVINGQQAEWDGRGWKAVK